MNDDRRPDPDALLERVDHEERRRARGRLKVFFGAAPGVGKTYSMLEAAQIEKKQGREVLVGCVETHGRPETSALLMGLEVLAQRNLSYRGRTLSEFDLDAALSRRGALILVDELAHSNVPGSRHLKRWQDVVELLESGCDVYTTMNVQHLESLVDVVAQITGITVRETVPDSVFENADEVELIDLPPDALLERLRAGKVYIPEQARRAMQSFFRKGNLIALRELALRRTAESVDAEMQSYKRDHGISETWAAADRFLVCVGPNPMSARLIRATRRMAAVLRADWTAVYVESSTQMRLSESARAQVAENLRLAERLGGETVILSGDRVADVVLEFARVRNVTKIVVGKPTHPRWRDRVYGSLLDAIVRGSGEIDVYAIRGEAEEDEPSRPIMQRARERWPAYMASLSTVVMTTLICRLMYPRFELADLAMVYLAGVVFVAVRFGQRPSVMASILSVASLDFFFVQPRFTFAVADFRHAVTFAVMLMVGLITGTLARRLRRQLETARHREQRTAALYKLSRELASAAGTDAIAEAAARNLSDVLGARVAILLPDSNGLLTALATGSDGFTLDDRERSVAQWVMDLGQAAGPGTDTLPGAGALYLPLKGSREMIGVLGVTPGSEGAERDPEQLHLLEAFAHLISSSLERAGLAQQSEQARLAVEREELRESLLQSVSHDLRTPLAVVQGAASTLLESSSTMDPATRGELLLTIHEESEHLSRLVRNLLDMTRLESGSLELKREWTPLEEVIGAALSRMEGRIGAREVKLDLPRDLPLILLDGVLIEQVLVNLIENALKYTSSDQPIEISAVSRPDGVIVRVADRGPGIPEGMEERVFEKFTRGGGDKPSGGAGGGVGLGLSICRGLVGAHGGRIWVENRAGGGSVFSFLLPEDEAPPSTQPEPISGGG